MTAEKSQLRSGRETTRGLSRFSHSENGTVPFPKRLLVAAGMLFALAAVVVVVLVRAPKQEEPLDAADVPLGVEEAAIIRYAGPRLVAQPYRRGASVNLRIAEEAQVGDVRVYDVRYVVNLPGEFELTDYLTSADGLPIDDLPTFRVRGLSSLSKDIETRIREIEDVGVHVWHWYHETLVGLGVFWVLWLAGLIFIARPARPPKPPPAPPVPSLDDQIAACLDALAGGQLSVQGKARLEVLLLKKWRQELRLHKLRMAAACRRIERSDPLGRVYGTLEAWLHDPAAGVGADEFLAACRPLVRRGSVGRRGEVAP